jgi:hypothetical protein
MARAPKKPEDVKDERGAEGRFVQGVKRALETPPKPHEEMKAELLARRKTKVSKKDGRSQAHEHRLPER